MLPELWFEPSCSTASADVPGPVLADMSGFGCDSMVSIDVIVGRATPVWSGSEARGS